MSAGTPGVGGQASASGIWDDIDREIQELQKQVNKVGAQFAQEGGVSQKVAALNVRIKEALAKGDVGVYNIDQNRITGLNASIKKLASEERLRGKGFIGRGFAQVGLFFARLFSKNRFAINIKNYNKLSQKSIQSQKILKGSAARSTTQTVTATAKSVQEATTKLEALDEELTSERTRGLYFLAPGERNNPNQVNVVVREEKGITTYPLVKDEDQFVHTDDNGLEARFPTLDEFFEFLAESEAVKNVDRLKPYETKAIPIDHRERDDTTSPEYTVQLYEGKASQDSSPGPVEPRVATVQKPIEEKVGRETRYYTGVDDFIQSKAREHNVPFKPMTGRGGEFADPATLQGKPVGTWAIVIEGQKPTGGFFSWFQRSGKETAAPQNITLHMVIQGDHGPTIVAHPFTRRPIEKGKEMHPEPKSDFRNAAVSGVGYQNTHKSLTGMVNSDFNRKELDELNRLQLDKLFRPYEVQNPMSNSAEANVSLPFVVLPREKAEEIFGRPQGCKFTPDFYLVTDPTTRGEGQMDYGRIEPIQIQFDGTLRVGSGEIFQDVAQLREQYRLGVSPKPRKNSAVLQKEIQQTLGSVQGEVNTDKIPQLLGEGADSVGYTLIPGKVQAGERQGGVTQYRLQEYTREPRQRGSENISDVRVLPNGQVLVTRTLEQEEQGQAGRTGVESFNDIKTFFAKKLQGKTSLAVAQKMSVLSKKEKELAETAITNITRACGAAFVDSAAQATEILMGASQLNPQADYSNRYLFYRKDPGGFDLALTYLEKNSDGIFEQCTVDVEIKGGEVVFKEPLKGTVKTSQLKSFLIKKNLKVDAGAMVSQWGQHHGFVEQVKKRPDCIDSVEGNRILQQISTNACLQPDEKEGVYFLTVESENGIPKVFRYSIDKENDGSLQIKKSECQAATPPSLDVTKAARGVEKEMLERTQEVRRSIVEQTMREQLLHDGFRGNQTVEDVQGEIQASVAFLHDRFPQGIPKGAWAVVPDDTSQARDGGGFNALLSLGAKFGAGLARKAGFENMAQRLQMAGDTGRYQVVCADAKGNFNIHRVAISEDGLSIEVIKHDGATARTQSMDDALKSCGVKEELSINVLKSQESLAEEIEARIEKHEAFASEDEIKQIRANPKRYEGCCYVKKGGDGTYLFCWIKDGKENSRELKTRTKPGKCIAFLGQKRGKEEEVESIDSLIEIAREKLKERLPTFRATYDEADDERIQQRVDHGGAIESDMPRVATTRASAARPTQAPTPKSTPAPGPAPSTARVERTNVKIEGVKREKLQPEQVPVSVVDVEELGARFKHQDGRYAGAYYKLGTLGQKKAQKELFTKLDEWKREGKELAPEAAKRVLQYLLADNNFDKEYRNVEDITKVTVANLHSGMKKADRDSLITWVWGAYQKRK